MKMKLIALCLITAILAGAAFSPIIAKAGDNDLFNEKVISKYEEKLGKMNVTIKTANLSQSQSALITGFDVDWKAGTVYIMPTDSSSIKITQKGYTSLNKNDQMTYLVEKGILKVKDDRKKIQLFTEKYGENTVMSPPLIRNGSWFIDQNGREAMKRFYSYCKKTMYDLIIQVPKKQYASFDFDSEYASCSLKDMKITKTETDSTSGIVQYNNCVIGEASGETVNGSIFLVRSAIRDVDLEAVNGELWSEDCVITDMKLDVINGDIKVSKRFPSGDCKLEAVNGDIYILPKDFPSGLSKGFKAKVANGDIHITLPSNKGFYIPSKNIGNGDINSKFKLKKTSKGYVYGDGSALLNVWCSNGDIAIFKAD